MPQMNQTDPNITVCTRTKSTLQKNTSLNNVKLTVFSIQSKINIHTKKQEKKNHSQEKKIQSLLTDPDMTEMMN